MKKNCLLILLLMLPLLAAAQQSRIDEIAAHLDSQCVSLRYDCTLTAQQAPVRLTGTLLAQQDCYFAVGNGMAIYCDGKNRWTVDPESREVYIETAGGREELVAMRDAITELKISELSYLPLAEDLSRFRFDTDDLDDSWVVTDLR